MTPLLDAARQLATQVSPRSEEIELARRLPADLVREMAEAGLFHMVVPEAYGGAELHPALAFEAFETVARADGSTGWCLMIGALTGMASAWLPESTARTLYTPGVITGGVAAPIGRAEAVEGGYRVTGRWPWASGSDHCQWLVGGVLVTQEGKPRLREGFPEVRLLLLPREEVTLHDTWHASGLCGTGSGDMEVRDVFVPTERSLSLLSERPRIDRPLYTFSTFGLLALGIPAVALGIARRAIDELTAVQEAVADAEATLRSARAFVLETVHASFQAASRGEVSVRHKAELRLAYTHATRSAARAVDRMYESAGGNAVFRSSPLQRCFRDIHVVTQHALVAGPTLELTGSVLLGLPPSPML
jgi:alkylation response protein AidB-like acyl-CoA dehydrogenase